MFYTTKCIVLSSLKFGDTDLIVKTFTKTQGPLTFMLKGVRKSKKGKFKVAMFQPMSLLEIEFNYRENKNFQYFMEVKPSCTLHQTQSSFIKTTVALFIAEVLTNSLKEGSKDAALFHYIENVIINLENAISYANLPTLFCIELTRFLGFYPEEKSLHKQYFNLEEGCFESELIHANCRSGKEVEKLKEIMTASNKEMVSMNQKTRRELIALLQRYYEIHLPGYQYPKSLPVIQDLLDQF